MPLTPDVDTYVTVAEADEYFLNHYGYPKWTGLSTEEKEQSLRSAVQKLDLSCIWFGERCAAGQPLAFPRDEQDCTTPQGIKDAQCEIAYLIVDNGSANASDENPLSELTAGSVTLKWHNEVAAINPLESGLISSLLDDFGSCASSSSTTKLIPIGRA